MITKTQILHSLDNLPEIVSVDQVIERLIFIEKIQKGMDDSKNRRVNTKDESKNKLGRWIK